MWINWEMSTKSTDWHLTLLNIDIWMSKKCQKLWLGVWKTHRFVSFGPKSDSPAVNNLKCLSQICQIGPKVGLRLTLRRIALWMSKKMQKNCHFFSTKLPMAKGCQVRHRFLPTTRTKQKQNEQATYWVYLERRYINK